MLSFLLAALESAEDKKRFTLIYEQHRPRMEQTAIRILKNQSDAEDAVQNAFMQIIRHFDKVFLIPCEELPFWIISIVKNEALMILRKNKREVPLEDWIVVSEKAEAAANYEDLVDLIRQLPESYRAVLEMKLLLGYTDKETARHLNITETAVSTRASRGRELLRSIMEKEGLRP